MSEIPEDVMKEAKDAFKSVVSPNGQRVWNGWQSG